MINFDAYLPHFENHIARRLVNYDNYNSSKVIRYCQPFWNESRKFGDDCVRFNFHLDNDDKKLFAGVLFAHTLLSQILHFYKKEFPNIQSVSENKERQVLFPEIIGGLLSSYDLHICPTVIPLGVLYVDELDDDIIRSTGTHLSARHARTTWCMEHQLFEECIKWLKLNLKEKVFQLTSATIANSDEEKLLKIIDDEMKRLNDEFGYAN